MDFTEFAAELAQDFTEAKSLAGAAAALASTDSEKNRDRFMQAYVDVAFQAA